VEAVLLSFDHRSHCYHHIVFLVASIRLRLAVSYSRISQEEEDSVGKVEKNLGTAFDTQCFYMKHIYMDRLAKFVAGKYVPLHGIQISTRNTCLHDSVPERLVVNTTCLFMDLHGLVGKRRSMQLRCCQIRQAEKDGTNLSASGCNNSLLNG
jgi:hypothetical protein